MKSQGARYRLVKKLRASGSTRDQRLADMISGPSPFNRDMALREIQRRRKS